MEEVAGSCQVEEIDETLSDGSSSRSSSNDSTPTTSPRGPPLPPPDPAVICQACLIGDFDEVRVCLENPAAVNCCDADGRTPLHAAAYSDEPQIVQMLIAAGAIVNAKDRFLLTPLHRACSSRAHAIVSQLITAGADLNKKDNSWQTPLHVAANSGAATCVRFLIKAGAYVEERDRFGRTPLHLAASLSVRISSHSEAAGDICKLLIDKGHASLTVRDNLGRHPIHYASASANYSTFKVLNDFGAKLDVTDSELFMPIHCATISGSASILSQIICLGAIAQPSFSHQIEALTTGDESPLHFAAALGFTDCVQTLLKHGADPELANAHAATPVHYAAGASHGYDTMALLLKGSGQPWKVCNQPDSHGRTPCHYAAYAGSLERLKMLLRCSLEKLEQCAACADDVVCIHNRSLAVRTDEFGLEPIHYAASQGHTEVCKLLVKFYAFDEFRSSNSLKRAGKECLRVFPLLLACASGNDECCKVLLDAIPTNVRNLDSYTDALGRNCLHAGCFSGSAQVVDLIGNSHYFADFNRRCPGASGWAPIHFVAAARNRRYAAEAVKSLLDHGDDLLDPNVIDDQGKTALMIASAMDDASNCVFNSLISFANADPLIVDNKARSLLHYASGNAKGGGDKAMNSAQNPSSSGLVERCAISRILSSPEDANKSILANSNGPEPSSSSPSSSSSLLSPADAGELVDLALVGSQCNPLHIACFYGLTANLAALVPLMPALMSAGDEFGWTPLHYAAALTNPEAAADCIQLLLAGGASIIAKECRNGWTPLHVAAYYGVPSTVRLLVDYVANSSENQLSSIFSQSRRPILPEPSTFINCRDKFLRTPLHLAISSRHRESVCVLLHRGADFRARDSNKRSALHRAVFIGDLELVQWLSKAEPQNLLIKDSKLGRNVLHLAVSRGNSEIVEAIANAFPKLVVCRDNEGISPLHLAAWQKQAPPAVAFTGFETDRENKNGEAILKTLLETLDSELTKKLQKEYRNKLSPLHYAAMGDRLSAFDLLVKKFVENDENTDKQAAWREHLLHFEDSKGRTLFHAVFTSGSVPIFRRLVDMLGLATCSLQLPVADRTRRKWTPMHYAIFYGRLNLLRNVVDSIGEPGLVDILEPEHLQLAVRRGHEGVSVFLVDTFVNVETSKNSIVNFTDGVLFHAINKGLVRLVEVLLNLGVDPLVGSTPTHSRVSKPALFAACKSESQATCLDLALTYANSTKKQQVKECWADAGGGGDSASDSVRAASDDILVGELSPRHSDDAGNGKNNENYEDMDDNNNINSSDNKKDSGLGVASADSVVSGRKSSASGFSDDNEFF